jgi:CMP/dCMP kinase
MIITLTGLPGAGKSTIATLLSEKLGIPRYSMGDLRGKMAQERSMTIDELNELGMKEDFTDKEVDAYQKNLGQTLEAFVIDGWMSWHFIPHAFKVFLDVEPQEGARRIFEAKRHITQSDEPAHASVEETMKTLDARVKQTWQRYKKYYDVDFLDRSQYDLIIDSTHKSPEEIINAIIKALDEKAG